MVNYFKDLPFKQKIGFVCLVVAGIGFLFAIISGNLGQGKTEQPAPSPTSAPQQNPNTPVATPKTTATATASATPSASVMPEIKYGENKIPVSEIRSLQTVANKGLIEFLTWKTGENKKERSDRIAQYFTANSEYLNIAPDFESAQSYETETGQGGMTALGSVDYINPVGGDAKLYRLTMGSVSRIQYNYENTGTEKSSVVETSLTLAVDMTKEQGAWKIKTISEE